MAAMIRISQDARKPWIRYLGVPMGNNPCSFCKDAIEEINMREFDAGNVVIIRPDFNASAILTSFHIELTEDPFDTPINNKENVAHIRHIKEMQRLEREAREDGGENGVSGRALKFARKIGTRQTEVRLHNMMAGDKPFLYEMGLPVCPLDEDLTYHVNVQQRIPMANDRDTVSENYLKNLYGQLLNEIYMEVETEKASAKWVREATKSSWVKKEAAACIVYKRYGDKVVINTPNNPLANDDALSQGFKVVGGSEMSGEEWETIKGFGLIQSSAEKFGKLGVAGTYVEPTPDMQNVATLFKRLAQETVGFAVNIMFVESNATNLAQYGDRTITINVSNLGAAWFKPNNLKAQLSLFVHELGHEYGLHCDAAYHQALTDIGAKLVCLALVSPSVFDVGAI